MDIRHDHDLLREAGIDRDSWLLRLLRRLAGPPAPPASAQADDDAPAGSGIFGTWGQDAYGLPCYHYDLDQYADPRAAYPNSANLDRRDHWHQIGNDRITALASNDGTVQVYLGDRGGVFLNHFAARDEAVLFPPDAASLKQRLIALARRALQWLVRAYFAVQGWWRRQRLGRPARGPRARRIHSGGDIHARGVNRDDPPPFIPQDLPPRPSQRVAYAGGFGYLDDGEAIWSTAYRYRAPTSAIRRTFGMGYADTETVHRSVRARRRVYAPYGDHPFLLADIDLENTGDTPVELVYYEYWDVNVQQLKLQWLRGPAFALAGDEERLAINDRFLPRITWDSATCALRFHQTPTDPADPDAINEIDVAPADVFLADLHGEADAYIVDKFAFFGAGGPGEPDAIRSGTTTLPDAPPGDSMPYCLVLRRRVALAPGERASLRYAYGAARPEQSLDFLIPFREGDWQARAAANWQRDAVHFSTGHDPALEREMAWHAYSLLASTVYNAYYDTHLPPQGSAYLYLHGADGAPRDQALFALPLVYLRPRLARETLKLMMALQNARTGAIPYSFAGHGAQSSAVIHQAPSDLDLFFLLALNEYLAATGDFSLLADDIPFYPLTSSDLPPGTQGRTGLDHVRAAVAHLILEVGTGANGLLRIGDGDWSDGVVFESCLKFGGVGALAWFSNSQQHGESIPNTQMALYVLTQSAAILEPIDTSLCQRLREFSAGLEVAIAGQWNGRWYRRAILRDASNQPVLLDNDRINLEAQPWALISGAAARAGTSDAMIQSITALLDDPSPTGPPLTEGGMVWPAVSQLLTWGYCRARPDLAWRSLLRHSFAVRAAIFPENWIGLWSGPDATYPLSAGAGGHTWTSPATPMIDFPVMNNNPHAMSLLGLLRVCGIEPLDDGSGLRIEPHVPRERFALHTALLSLIVTPDGIYGEYRPVADGGRRLALRVPANAVNLQVRVAGETLSPERDTTGFVTLNLVCTTGRAVPFEVRWQVSKFAFSKPRRASADSTSIIK